VDVDATRDAVTWLESADQPKLLVALLGLYYAIYYGPVEQSKTLPDQVLRAYARAHGALNV
jgi:hypothetical protein